ncbi:MAG: hypothetical protein FJ314_04590 [SAR202 cluster bacterium]|nr:hypothetical protein [SAR202 cluster bacterium]
MAKRRADPKVQRNTRSDARPDELRYAVDFDAMEASGKSAAYFVRSRICADASARAGGSGGDQLKDLLKIIATDCKGKPDYIGAATPLSEAIFRILLASGNRPQSIRNIQDGLTEAWATVIYMKDLSPELLSRLLDRPNAYFMKQVAG